MRGKDERLVPLNAKLSEAGTMSYSSQFAQRPTYTQIFVEWIITQIRADPHWMLAQHPGLLLWGIIHNLDCENCFQKYFLLQCTLHENKCIERASVYPA